MLERGKAYIVKAGTIILVCNTAVQIMQSFNWQLQLIEEERKAHPFWRLLLIPLPFCLFRWALVHGSWQQRQ